MKIIISLALLLLSACDQSDPKIYEGTWKGRLGMNVNEFTVIVENKDNIIVKQGSGAYTAKLGDKPNELLINTGGEELSLVLQPSGVLVGGGYIYNKQ